MTENTKDFSLPRLILDIFVDVVVVVCLVLIIRYFFLAPFKVHGSSMCDTFNIYNEQCINSDGEHILTTRFTRWNIGEWRAVEIERGDVVVIQDPNSDRKEYMIKRVIGLPGETLKIEEGDVFIAQEDAEFELLNESYLNEENQGNTNPFRMTSATYEIPEDSYFIMGDNRVKSSDSRRCFHQPGCNDNNSPFVEHSEIEGIVRLVIYPFSHMRLIRDVSY